MDLLFLVNSILKYVIVRLDIVKVSLDSRKGLFLFEALFFWKKMNDE